MNLNYKIFKYLKLCILDFWNLDFYIIKITSKKLMCIQVIFFFLIPEFKFFVCFETYIFKILEYSKNSFLSSFDISEFFEIKMWNFFNFQKF